MIYVMISPRLFLRRRKCGQQQLAGGKTAESGTFLMRLVAWKSKTRQLPTFDPPLIEYPKLRRLSIGIFGR
jgi:hypothetical protein